MIDLRHALEQALDRVDSSLGEEEIGRGPQHVRHLLSGFDVEAADWNDVASAVVGSYLEQRDALPRHLADGTDLLEVSREDEESLAAGLLAYGVAIGELHANARHAELAEKVRRADELVQALRQREETFAREWPRLLAAAHPAVEQHIDALEAGIAALQITLEGGVRDALDG